ncbi:GAK system CofD-like protein [Neptunomonas japonica]|uniref:GAK system CofD-like protein n=1 Tax=Neptunomonas japonica TaxID=417574 RepID=UPI0004155571|nr:GAK system CofD-like protein [Neptunomonas japonica]
MNKILIQRQVSLPDPMRISRYYKSPELGPRILFFSGGSALKQTSRILKHYTHNSVHLVTAFDSGGSSAKLRSAFDMPAIGDLRSRLLALADETITGSPATYALFNYRLPESSTDAELTAQLSSIAEGTDPLIVAIQQPMRDLVRNLLSFFINVMPENFNLRGASIGNLLISGGYLTHNRQLEPVIFLLSKLINTLGKVHAITEESLHLTAHLEDGQRIVGQHRITGKEAPPLESRIKDISLSSDPDYYQKTQCQLSAPLSTLIKEADLICYPPGSFYSSILTNLLPVGVSESIQENTCPKVYIPSLGKDPELYGTTISQAIQQLLKYLKAESLKKENEQFLNIILIDSRFTEVDAETQQYLASYNIQIIDTPLVTPDSAPYYSAEKLVHALLSLT